MSDTLISHNRLNICKIQIDETRFKDQIRYTLYTLLKYFIRLAESILDRCSLIANLQKFIVRNNNQCIHIFFQTLDPKKRIVHTRFTLKNKRLRHNAYRQYSQIFGDFCHNRSCTCTGSAAHTAGHEYHIGILDKLCDLITVLFHSSCSDLRLRSGAQSLCQPLANLDASGGFT